MEDTASTSSDKMEQSKDWTRISHLGNSIIEAISTNDRADLLTAWMANYIAELMNEINSANATDQLHLREECARAICQLWDHRASWNTSAPNDNINRALQSAASHVERTNSKDLQTWADLLVSLMQYSKDENMVCFSAIVADIPRSDIEANGKWIEEESDNLDENEREKAASIQRIYDEIHSEECLISPHFGDLSEDERNKFAKQKLQEIFRIKMGIVENFSRTIRPES